MRGHQPLLLLAAASAVLSIHVTKANRPLHGAADVGSGLLSPSLLTSSKAQRRNGL